jgi:dTDP-4-dehydrorhamnose reductase
MPTLHPDSLPAPPAGMVPLVLGAGGMLGAAMTAVLEEPCPAIVAATRAEIDLTDRFRLEAEVERLTPTVVFNCAAWSDVDGCEADPGRAFRVNAEGAENAARAAAAAGCRFVHFSSDLVFDGRRTDPYTEDDPPAPLSVHGRSRLEGEQRVAAAAPDHLIVRTAWLYGAGRGNFVEVVRAAARTGSPLRIAGGQTGSPSWVLDVALAVAGLLAAPHRGLLHVVNEGCCTRRELVQAIVEAIGGRVRVESIPAGCSTRPAPRPEYSALATGRYAAIAGRPLRPWREALLDYLAGDAAAVSA